MGATSTKDGAASETVAASDAGGKSAAIVQKLDDTWSKIADEDQTVSLAAATVVQFGANDSWIQKTVTGSLSCTNAFFGQDPAPFVAKACYTQGGTGTGSGTATRIAGEDEAFTVASATVVKYGAGSSWVQMTVTGAGTCSNAFFGQDPAPNVAKACYTVGSSTGNGTGTTTRIADEDQTFTFASATLVQYGAGANWIPKTVIGTGTCSNAFFGQDPAPNVVKACYTVGSSTGTDPALPSDILNGSGTVDATAYRNIAAVMGKEGGVAYRYGPTPTDYGTTGNGGRPTYFKQNDNGFVSNQNGGQRPCNPENCGTWQVGNWSDDVGGYSSNFGHVAFIADSPSQRVGFAGLAISSVSNGVFSQKPELSWTLYGNGLDEVNAVDYRAGGMDTTNPVAVARCYGRPGWCLSSIMVWQNGLIGVAGNPTAKNKATAQLAAGKVPTAIAVSNSAEFAFITVWDTVNLRGEIAVVALAGLCDRCTTSNPASYNWWGEWQGVYPGLPNIGNIAFMKVLGYVPLPADMKAPTEISVTTGVDRNAYLQAGTPGYTSPSDVPLSSASNRNTFKAGGGNHNTYAKTGVAVVVSKSEQKVAFVDLKPLFQYYQSMYFGNDADYNATTNIGSGDSQWPRTFSAASQQTPTVIKTMSLASRPTAVKAYMWGGGKRAWVATQDGKLRIFNLGDYPTTGSGSAASITEGASVPVGRNPTGIAYPKEKAGATIYPDMLKEVIVTSRGDRQIDWVRFVGDFTSGSVVRTLKDSRLVDPISVEDTSNHSTESYVLSVADYGGRKLHNFRFGPVIMHNYGGQSYGMGSSGEDPFEYGGAYDLPGRAFLVVGANIP